MSISPNLQNVLEDTLNHFFMDISLNTLLQQIPLQPLHFSTPNPSIFPRETVNRHTHRVPEETKIEEEDNTLPDLIPIESENENNRNQNPPEFNTNQHSDYYSNLYPSNESAIRRYNLWSDLTKDYHSNFAMYQKNVESMLNITENVLELPNRNRPLSNIANSNTNYYNPLPTNTSPVTLNERLYNLLFPSTSSGSRYTPYILEFEGLLPLSQRTRRTNTSLDVNSDGIVAPTIQQIQNSTTLIIYNPVQDPLTNTICPITLEEFVSGEQLLRINYCGHIFKANSLHRWFVRNKVCPSCRHDITNIPTTFTI
jgi:hypothetical protein